VLREQSDPTDIAGISFGTRFSSLEVLEELLLFSIEQARQRRHEKDFRRQELTHAATTSDIEKAVEITGNGPFPSYAETLDKTKVAISDSSVR
jgi:hypothetical protein